MVDASMDTEEPNTSKKLSDLDADQIRSRIRKAEDQVKKGDINAGLEAFMAVEKQCRLAEDMGLSQETCRTIIDTLHEAGQWKLLLENITTLTKRRQQNSATVTTIVRRASEILDTVQDQAAQIEMIKVLQAVCEGKMYVEIDRARLTKRLAHLHERDGRVGDAADAMQEVAVETFGAMHKSEKIAYVLEQMRLCMDNRDFTRAQILSRKVSPKAFAAGAKEQEVGEKSLQGTAIEKPEEGTPDMAELKVLYYNSMIKFHKHSNNYIEIVRCLRALYADADEAAKADSSDSEKGAAAAALLKQIVWYLVLCPAYSTEEGAASDYLTLRAATAADPRLADLPDHQDLLQIFITEEVTGADALVERYHREMAAQESIFGGEDGKERASHLRRRITEHNVLAVSKYYARVRVPRLATLLGLPAHEAEASLADLATKGAVVAKIDRPAGVVTFGAAQDAPAVLDEWGASIGKLLGLVETAVQKIQKESMQYGVPIGAGA